MLIFSPSLHFSLQGYIQRPNGLLVGAKRNKPIKIISATDLYGNGVTSPGKVLYLTFSKVFEIPYPVDIKLFFFLSNR